MGGITQSPRGSDKIKRALGNRVILGMIFKYTVFFY